MLQITTPETELYDEANNIFIPVPSYTITLEHSLVSLSKWESRWCKPFLSKDGITTEQTIDYIRCMTLTPNIPEIVYNLLSDNNIKQVEKYINSPMTATWFSEDKKGKGKSSGEVVTSELIYYWMIALQIPIKCEHWHLNRLLTLIKICNIKNAPPKKMSRKEILNRNAALNAARRKQFHNNG